METSLDFDPSIIGPSLAMTYICLLGQRDLMLELRSHIPYFGNRRDLDVESRPNHLTWEMEFEEIAELVRDSKPEFAVSEMPFLDLVCEEILTACSSLEELYLACGGHAEDITAMRVLPGVRIRDMRWHCRAIDTIDQDEVLRCYQVFFSAFSSLAGLAWPVWSALQEDEGYFSASLRSVFQELDTVHKRTIAFLSPIEEVSKWGPYLRFINGSANFSAWFNEDTPNQPSL